MTTLRFFRTVSLGAAALACALLLGPAVGGSAAGSGPAGPSAKKRFELKRDLTWAQDEAQWRKIQNLVGRKAPALASGEWFNGQLKPGDAKDRIVLIDFWATWCGPCKAAVPHTNKLMESYADKGVLVIGVCNREGSDKMAEVAKSTGMKFPTARDKTGRLAQDYAVQWWPYYVVIDRKGVVRGAGLRPDRLDQVLDALIAEQPFEAPESQ